MTRALIALTFALAVASTAEAAPADTAKALLDKQIAALTKADGKGFTETFAPTAIVLVPTARQVSDKSVDLVQDVARTFGSKSVKSLKSSKLVAGAAGGGIWFSAELAIELSVGKPIKVRAVELVDASGKVIAASFGEIMAARPLGDTEAIEPANTAGPLAKLLTAPKDVAAALAKDPVLVQGTDPKEYAATQAAAKKLLGTWSTLKLTVEGDKVYEVRTKDVGFAMAVVNYPSKKKKDIPNRLSALVIAVPAGDQWQVVALSYAPF